MLMRSTKFTVRYTKTEERINQLREQSKAQEMVQLVQQNIVNNKRLDTASFEISQLIISCIVDAGDKTMEDEVLGIVVKVTNLISDNVLREVFEVPDVNFDQILNLITSYRQRTFDPSDGIKIVIAYERNEKKFILGFELTEQNVYNPDRSLYYTLTSTRARHVIINMLLAQLPLCMSQENDIVVYSDDNIIFRYN